MMRELLTRRRALLAGGAAALAIAAGAGLFWGHSEGGRLPIGRLDTRKVTDIGDDFYLVDGWVLPASDLAELGISVAVSKKQ